MINVRFVFGCLLIFSGVSCSPSKSAIGNQKADWQTFMVKKLGEGYIATPNNLNSMILCEQRGSSIGKSIKFAVVRLNDGAILYEGKFVSGHVKWISPEAIEIKSVPGMIRANQTSKDFTKVIQLSN